jgi:hypothetical protein
MRASRATKRVEVFTLVSVALTLLFAGRPMPTVYTPKAFHLEAQGREQSERTLGNEGVVPSTPKTLRAK